MGIWQYAEYIGRTGSCLDNAVAEAWFLSLRKELGHTSVATRAHARRAIFAWINDSGGQGPQAAMPHAQVVGDDVGVDNHRGCTHP